MSDFINGQLQQANEMFENIFRKNILAIILMILLANGYSTIPGVEKLLKQIFENKYVRFIITYILIFQIIDDHRITFINTVLIYVILEVIERYELNNNKDNQQE